MKIQLPEQGGAPTKKKQFPWMIVLAGCGGLTLLMLIAVGIGGYFMISTVSSTIGGDGEGEHYLEKMVREDIERSKSRKPRKKTASGREMLPVEEHQDAITVDKVRGYLSKPVTKAMIQGVNKSATVWKKNDAVIEQQKSGKAIKELEKKEKLSALEKAKAARTFTKSVRSQIGIGGAIDEHVEQDGGYEKHFSRLMPIVGVLLATDYMAKEHGVKDKHSDAAIQHVLTEQPKIVAAYKKGKKDIKADVARGENVMAITYTDKIGRKAGAVAMAFMPASSFKT